MKLFYYEGVTDCFVDERVEIWLLSQTPFVGNRDHKSVLVVVVVVVVVIVVVVVVIIVVVISVDDTKTKQIFTFVEKMIFPCFKRERERNGKRGNV